MIRYLLILALLVLSGCQPDDKPLLRLKDTDKSPNASIHGEDKPMYREITDEFGIGKSWGF